MSRTMAPNLIVPPWQLALFAELRRWAGTRYVPGAQCARRGVDCVGLVAGVFDRLHGLPPHIPPRAAQDAAWHDWRAAARATAAIAHRWPHVVIRRPKPTDIEPGDALLIRTGQGGGHVGIVGRPPEIWHAVRGAGVVMTGIGGFRAEIIRLYRSTLRESWGTAALNN